MTEHFGQGIYISTGSEDYPWDIEIDTTGDIRTTRTTHRELEKDMAFRSASNIQDILGQPLTPTSMNKISSRIRETLLEDERISELISLDVSRVQGSQNTVSIISTVATADGEFELVYEVER